MTIRQQLLSQAIKSYNNHKSQITNKLYIGIIDYSLSSAQHRFYLYNLHSKSIINSFHVAHGKGSADIHNKSKAIHFSNNIGSQMSSLGGIKTGNVFIGRHGRSLKLIGLDASNNNISRRSIEIHSANYVSDDFIKQNNRAGLSWGCLAVSPADISHVILSLQGGAFIYAGH